MLIDVTVTGYKIIQGQHVVIPVLRNNADYYRIKSPQLFEDEDGSKKIIYVEHDFAFKSIDDAQKIVDLILESVRLGQYKQCLEIKDILAGKNI